MKKLFAVLAVLFVSACASAQVVAAQQETEPALGSRTSSLGVGASVGLSWAIPNASEEEAPSIAIYGGTLSIPLSGGLSFSLGVDYGSFSILWVNVFSALFVDCAVSIDVAPQSPASLYLSLGGGYGRIELLGTGGGGVFVLGALGVRITPAPAVSLLVQADGRILSTGMPSTALLVALTGGFRFNF